MSNKNSTIRVVLILMAILSVVLAVVCALKLEKNVVEDTPQSDLSDYGSEIPSVEQGDGLIYDDDGTVEMDSIPNGVLTSGADVASGADAAEEADTAADQNAQ